MDPVKPLINVTLYCITRKDLALAAFGVGVLIGVAHSLGEYAGKRQARAEAAKK